MYKTVATAARVLTICLAATLTANAAEAADSVQTQASDARLQYLVRFQDLDLSNIDGVSLLYRRLHSAAEVVCAPLERADFKGTTAHEACVNKAIGDAVVTVDHPLLTQYHQLRSKGDRAGIALLAKAQVQ